MHIVISTIATLLWDSLSTRKEFGTDFQEEPESLEPGEKEGEPEQRKDSREDRAIGGLRSGWNYNLKHFFSTHMLPCVAYEGVR